ncbi:MAG: decaprenyl-phosphate phosphoribosyltransferase [Vicinamibacterales bacterium]
MARSTLRPSRGAATEMLLSLRPAQWTKNLILFGGLIFGGRLFDPVAVRASVLGFLVFCVLSGVVYLVNDVRDIEADRQHPTKSQRPIAAGVISPAVALTEAIVLAAAGLATAWWLAPTFGAVATGYVALLTIYSTALKHVVILDVLAIAGGFVLRAVGGAVVIGVAISHWLLVITLLGALFLALGKRRGEIATLVDGGTGHRPILAHYSTDLLDQLITIVASSTLLAYAFYTISPDTVAKFNTDKLLFTLPFPLYGVFRYLYLIHKHDGGANPSETLLSDRPILLCVVLWAFAAAFVIYGPWR